MGQLDFDLLSTPQLLPNLVTECCGALLAHADPQTFTCEQINYRQ